MNRVKLTEINTNNPIYINLKKCNIVARGMWSDVEGKKPSVPATLLFVDGVATPICVDELPETFLKFNVPAAPPAQEKVLPEMSDEEKRAGEYLERRKEEKNKKMAADRLLANSGIKSLRDLKGPTQ